MNRSTRQYPFYGSCAAAGLWLVLLLGCSFLRGPQAAAAMVWAAEAVQGVGIAFAGELSPAVRDWLAAATPYLVQLLGYMGLAVLSWNALRFRLGRYASLALALAVVSLTAVLDELHQILVPGREPRLLDWVLDMAGAVCLLGGIWLFQWMWQHFPKLVNRETVSYVVFGVLTTVVNIVSFQLSYYALPLSDFWNNLIANSLAWVLSVAFAYVVNKLFVFQSRTHGVRQLLAEAGKFVGARVFSYLVDMAGMVLLINVLHVHSGIAKALVNVIVMIMNYFFSILFIFKGRKSGEKAQ